MKKFRLTRWAALGAAAIGVTLAACVAGPSGVHTLRGADAATADEAPVVREQIGKRPGAQQNIARTFKGQPPLIPHATDNFDEVSLEENQCLSCHGDESYQKKNAPRLGDAHYVDRDGKKLSEADKRRYACTLCHVPQFNAPPLVNSTFRPN